MSLCQCSKTLCLNLSALDGGLVISAWVWVNGSKEIHTRLVNLEYPGEDLSMLGGGRVSRTVLIIPKTLECTF